VTIALQAPRALRARLASGRIRRRSVTLVVTDVASGAKTTVRAQFAAV
jgi:hypothetical protein